MSSWGCIECQVVFIGLLANDSHRIFMGGGSTGVCHRGNTCQGKSYFYFWKQMCIPPADESRVNDSEGPMII
jgi:hypothetical protein